MLEWFKNLNKALKITLIFVLIGSGVGIYFLADYLLVPDYQMEEGTFNRQDLFVSGEGGYKCYRIPALLVLPNDKILAFCEARKDNCDDYGNIDLVVKKSEDGGKTWGDMIVIWDAGIYPVQEPMPVYDETTQTIIMGAFWNRTDYYIINSTDFGETWNDPWHLDYLKPDGVLVFGPSPGHGIILESGRILFPGIHQRDSAEHKNWQAHYVYSDDHGLTWQFGHEYEKGVNECLAVELVNNSVMMIFRRNHHYSDDTLLWTSISNDEGITGSTPTPDEELLSPPCQASICRFTKNDTYMKNRILLLNPNSSEDRIRMTVKMSYDEGSSWEVKKLIYEGPSAYSDIQVLSNNTVCAFFENGRRYKYERISFVQFNLDFISDTDELTLR